MNNQFNITVEDTKKFNIQELCSQAVAIKSKIDDLSKIKKSIEDDLRNLLDHSEAGEGTQTYKEGNAKISITTGYNYRIDANLYETIGDTLDDRINPVKEKITYSLDKKKLEIAHEFATDDELDLLDKLVLTSQKKPSIKIEITKGHLA